MAKRRVAAIVKIQIQAVAATPAPPVGTALGPHGINIMDFCKAYNAQTESQRGTVIPAEITIYEDRSFTCITKTSPTPVPRMSSTSRRESGVGLAPLPTKPVTPGVLRTTYQASSSSPMRTSR